MERRIVINADDFGLTEGINRGIVQAHTDGVLTSTTIMANMPAAEKAVKMAKRQPKLGVGIHLNLSEGQPISSQAGIDCLVNEDGLFTYSPSKLAFLSLTSNKIRKALRSELAAQIQWLIDSGIKPTHLDSHKHIHCFPAIFPIICSLAREFEITAMRWPFEPGELSQMPWPLPSEGGRKRAKLIRLFAKINRIQNSSFFKTDVFLGIAHTGKIDVNFFKALALYNSAQTTELMTHPGFADGLNAANTRLLHQRKVELDALCSERTKQYLKEAGIELVHYGEL